MDKRNKKKLIASGIVILLPMLAGVCLWKQLPEQLPTHWNAAGEVDGWSSKAFTVFGLPGIILLCHLIAILGTQMDPKRKNIAGKMLNVLYWICPVVSILGCGAAYTAAWGLHLHIEIWTMVLVGILLIVLGNWFPKCQPNYTVGIKLPWTLYSEENWRKTHRMAGPVWIVGGVLTVITGFLGKAGVYVFLGIVLLITLIPVIYSYNLFRKAKNNG